MSNVVIPARAIQNVSQASDPKQAILDQVSKFLPDIDVLFNVVLVATYIRPNMTRGGIYRPDTNVQEDVWQGKVGLVLKLGSHAFEDDSEDVFKGQKVEVGDWCVYKVGDAWSLHINEYPCRLVKDSSIRLKVKDPSIVF